MSRIQSIRRLAGFVAGLATALLAAAISAPAALAVRVPPPGTGDTTPVVVHTRTIVEGGMPGWQIALITIGAAVAAAALAVLIDRARLARRKPATAVAAPEPTRVA
jgi:hypothetical protein